MHIRILSAIRRRYVRAGGIGLAFVVLSVAVTARVFVWPALQPLPERADAIIELAGPRDLDRDRVALELAREHRAPVLIQSTLPGDTACLPPVAGVRIECFHPDPNTTRGEARYIGAIAAQRHWHSVILVTTPDQAWRADLAGVAVLRRNGVQRHRSPAVERLVPTDPIPVARLDQSAHHPADLLDREPLRPSRVQPWLGSAQPAALAT